GEIRLRHAVVLSEPERAPAPVLQDLRDRGAFIRDAGVMARESVGPFRDAGHRVKVVIASRETGGAGRRTERLPVPPVSRDAITTLTRCPASRKGQRIPGP